MRRISRVMAALVGLSLTLSACSGGHNGSLLPAPGSGTGDQGSLSTAPVKSDLSASPLISVPHTYGKLAFTDAGRRDGKAPVTVVLTLRYNHQQELDRFVAELGRGRHHVLTPAQFNERYAPTREQEAAVVRELRKAGFTITQRYSNRTLVDAKAPARVVERFFHTEIHNVRQGTY